MKITSELALPIVKRLMTNLNYNINIMDEHGIIVASGDMTRLNQRHQGAVQVLTSGKEVNINEEDIELFSYTKPGVNLPIEFQDKTVGVVGITGCPNEMYQFARVVKMSVEVLLQQIFMNNQMQYQIKTVEGWILELVNPYEFDAKKLETNARFVHFDFQVERSVFLVRIKELTYSHFELYAHLDQLQKVNELKDQILNTLKMFIDPRSLYAILEEEVLFFAIPFSGKNYTDEKRLADKILQVLGKMNLSPLIGIGNRNKGIEGCRESYFQAKQCIKLLQKTNNHNNISHVEDWGIIRILDRIPTEVRKAFINKYIHANNQLSEELEETLRVFLECELHVKHAAAKLYIHHNTLIYRLERISDQLKLDPRKFNDAVLLKIIQNLQQLYED